MEIAVVPLADTALRLAERLAPRCALVGIEIAPVGSRGEVMDVKLQATGELSEKRAAR